MKIIFFGSSEYCLPILESLRKNFQLVTVITKKNQSVEKLAKKSNIPVWTPADKKELSTLEDIIQSLNPDITIVADYGLIIPQAIFNIPKYKTLNIHFSRLPDLRGASPVQYTILRGDEKAWITVQLLDVELDTGDILYQKDVNLDGTETTDSLYKKLFNIAATELPDIISGYVRNELKPIQQGHSKATYSKILTRDDGYIPSALLFSVILRSDDESERRIPSDIMKTQGILRFAQGDIQDINFLAIFIEHAIRAFTPWPGIWTYISKTRSDQDTSDGGEATTSTPPRWRNQNQKRLKILKAHLEQITTNHQPSTKIILDFVQLEGKKPVSWKQFIEGYPNIFKSDKENGKIPLL